MPSAETGREALTRICDYLVSFPFDLKILQEAVTDPELEHGVRELCAGVLIQSLAPQEGPPIERYVDDVVLLRLALEHVRAKGGEPAQGFVPRFEEVFVRLDDDLRLFEQLLGPELWAWISGRLTNLSRCLFKGKRPLQYVDDESTWDTLYEDGLEFQTNYNITDAQVQNRLRRPEQIVEILQKRYSDELKKRP